MKLHKEIWSNFMRRSSALRKIFSSIFSITLIIVIFGLGVSIFISGKKHTPAHNVVLGVNGIGGSSTTLVRTDDAVSLSYEVVESENGNIILSDFDDVYPYSEITRYIDKNDNVFVYIPKFYSKFTQNNDGTVKLQISKKKLNGFTTLFIDGSGKEIDYILYGAYESSGDVNQLYSKPGVRPATSLTIDETREASRANGTNYQQLDYTSTLIINQLFMVEFATVNSQTIFVGYTNASVVSETGLTDVINHSSGYTENGSFKYRGIENIYGNVWKYVDGIFFDIADIYISTDPYNYTNPFTSDNVVGYSLVSTKRSLSEGSYKSLMIFEEDASFVYPSYNGITSFGDYTVESKTNRETGITTYGQIMVYGGTCGFTTRSGIWCMFSEIQHNYTNIYYGSRLVYKPIGIFSRA